MPSIAKIVAEERKQAGLTQAQLAEKSGLPRESIARLEGGRVNPTVQYLEKLAAGMGKELEIRFK